MKDLKFEKPRTNVEEISEQGRYGKFVISPLERGFGITLGNALRRTLLSSLPGAAIVNVKIDGAEHEFQNVDGVVEDVITIILNLKRIVLTVDSDDPNYEKTIEINRGEGEVNAADIIHDNDIKVINPDQHIATVMAGGALHMFLTVRRGVGFVSSVANKEYSRSVGVIAIDSIYTPIVNVAFNVEKTRVEGVNVASFDKLEIEVTTNGSITAKEALAVASKMMIEHLNVVVELSEKANETDYMIETEDDNQGRKLDMTIDELDLTVRSYNCLKRAGINTVGELTEKSEEDMIKVRNLGRKSLKEIKEKLETLGLGFKKN
ncbi:MAG: DNA-directed RNA polymerase subunit alpha [Anaeroplasma sp.]|uniref:DNA-directed RNA polymerase subunit alpha n=1 Tax=Anaeroplasma sp. TaxID=1872523 RepID=UPI002A90BD8A|nr:DNA-directed RNA polymerase subunit alpha [Anaeroplasma sp.]MDY5982159.1 DNA-directed RNA polymerase subunit alpha [Anaeroplasma sp.]